MWKNLGGFILLISGRKQVATETLIKSVVSSAAESWRNLKNQGSNQKQKNEDIWNHDSGNLNFELSK